MLTRQKVAISNYLLEFLKSIPNSTGRCLTCGNLLLLILICWLTCSVTLSVKETHLRRRNSLFQDQQQILLRKQDPSGLFRHPHSSHGSSRIRKQRRSRRRVIRKGLQLDHNKVNQLADQATQKVTPLPPVQQLVPRNNQWTPNEVTSTDASYLNQQVIEQIKKRLFNMQDEINMMKTLLDNLVSVNKFGNSASTSLNFVRGSEGSQQQPSNSDIENHDKSLVGIQTTEGTKEVSRNLVSVNSLQPLLNDNKDHNTVEKPQAFLENQNFSPSNHIEYNPSISNAVTTVDQIPSEDTSNSIKSKRISGSEETESDVNSILIPTEKPVDTTMGKLQGNPITSYDVSPLTSPIEVDGSHFLNGEKELVNQRIDPLSTQYIHQNRLDHQDQRDHQDHQDNLKLPNHKNSLNNQEQQFNQNVQGHENIQNQRDLPSHQEHQFNQDLLDNQNHQELPNSQSYEHHQDLSDNQDLQNHHKHRFHQEVPNQQDFQSSLLTNQDVTDNQAHQFHQNLPNRQNLPSNQDLQNHHDLLNHQSIPSHQSHQIHSVHPSLQDLPDDQNPPNLQNLPSHLEHHFHRDLPDHKNLLYSQDIPNHEDSSINLENQFHQNRPTKQDPITNQNPQNHHDHQDLINNQGQQFQQDLSKHDLQNHQDPKNDQRHQFHQEYQEPQNQQVVRSREVLPDHQSLQILQDIPINQNPLVPLNVQSHQNLQSHQEHQFSQDLPIHQDLHDHQRHQFQQNVQNCQILLNDQNSQSHNLPTHQDLHNHPINQNIQSNEFLSAIKQISPTSQSGEFNVLGRSGTSFVDPYHNPAELKQDNSLNQPAGISHLPLESRTKSETIDRSTYSGYSRSRDGHESSVAGAEVSHRSNLNGDTSTATASASSSSGPYVDVLSNHPLPTDHPLPQEHGSYSASAEAAPSYPKDESSHNHLHSSMGGEYIDEMEYSAGGSHHGGDSMEGSYDWDDFHFTESDGHHHRRKKSSRFRRVVNKVKKVAVRGIEKAQEKSRFVNTVVEKTKLHGAPLVEKTVGQTREIVQLLSDGYKIHRSRRHSRKHSSSHRHSHGVIDDNEFNLERGVPDMLGSYPNVPPVAQ